MSIDYESVAKEVVELVNQARTNPTSFVEILSNNLKYFKGNIFARPGSVALQTVEGRAAFEEAIDFLKTQKPLGALKVDERLSQACKDHINDIGPLGVSSHDSSDGKNVSDRIERYCEWDGVLAENIDFGATSAQDIVLWWIVDDGLKNARTHRRNMFVPDILFAGVSTGEHKEHSVITVMNYVGGVRNKGVESPDIKNYVRDVNAEKKAPKNAFQEDDSDAPDNCVSVKFQKTEKEVEGKMRKVTKKIYTLSDGTLHIVEIEEA